MIVNYCNNTVDRYKATQDYSRAFLECLKT